MANLGELNFRKLTVFYGSQTGTAEEVAERIGRESRRRFIAANVLGMDEYHIVRKC